MVRQIFHVCGLNRDTLLSSLTTSKARGNLLLNSGSVGASHFKNMNSLMGPLPLEQLRKQNHTNIKSYVFAQCGKNGTPKIRRVSDHTLIAHNSLEKRTHCSFKTTDVLFCFKHGTAILQEPTMQEVNLIMHYNSHYCLVLCWYCFLKWNQLILGVNITTDEIL